MPVADLAGGPAIEPIEHVESEALGEVLGSLEGAARQRIVVSTPNSLLLRPGSETAVGFNPFEAHLSYARRAIFERRRYSVRGVGFGRYNSRLACGAKRLGVRNSLMSLPQRLPAAAETVVAVEGFH